MAQRQADRPILPATKQRDDQPGKEAQDRQASQVVLAQPGVTHAPVPASTAGIRALQRAIGNQRLLRLVARQPAPPQSPAPGRPAGPIQRSMFGIGTTLYDTTDHSIEELDTMLKQMTEAKNLKLILSLEQALQEDLQYPDDGGWVEDNQDGIKRLLAAIVSIKQKLETDEEDGSGSDSDGKKESLFHEIKGKVTEKIPDRIAVEMHQAKQKHLGRWLSYVKGRHNPDLGIVGSRIYVHLSAIDSDEQAAKVATTAEREVIKDKTGKYYGFITEV